MTKKELLMITNSLPKTEYVLGALGDLRGCDAYIEETRLDGEQGYLTKYFGISVPYRGMINRETIDRVTITKRAFLEILKSLPLGIRGITRRFYGVYSCDGGLKDWTLPEYQYCPAIKELIRAGKKVWDNALVMCFAMFLQFSPTYRYWVQDILGELNKERLARSLFWELVRLKRIFLDRLQVENISDYEKNEAYKKQMHKRLSFGWNILIAFAIIKRKEAMFFLMELDRFKVRLDDTDWYYCLRRRHYDFRGKSLYARLVEAEQIDTKEGNIIL